MGLIADTFTGSNPLSPTCSTDAKNSYIKLTNMGSASSSVQGVTITFGGADNVFKVAGSCVLGPSGSPDSTLYVLFGGPSKLVNSSVPQPSQPYLGTVNLSNGAGLPFNGNFFQGYPVISNAGAALSALDFGKGNPMNATCSTNLASSSSYVTLTNAGTVGVSVTQVTITWKGVTNQFNISGQCEVGPDGTQSATTYVLFGSANMLASAAEAGQQFTGGVSLSFGPAIQFSGTFA